MHCWSTSGNSGSFLCTPEQCKDGDNKGDKGGGIGGEWKNKGREVATGTGDGRIESRKGEGSAAGAAVETLPLFLDPYIYKYI